MEWENSQFSKKGLFALALVVLGGTYFYFQSGDTPHNSLKVPYPYTSNVASNTSFACEALLSSSIIGSPEEYLINGVEGVVEKGTDTVAMNIKDSQTLSFLTGASIKVGVSEGDGMAIIRNDDKKLMAVWFNESVISTVVLNKTNGLAIWLKGNPEFFTYGAPTGSVIYMVCH